MAFTRLLTSYFLPSGDRHLQIVVTGLVSHPEGLAGILARDAMFSVHMSNDALFVRHVCGVYRRCTAAKKITA